MRFHSPQIPLPLDFRMCFDENDFFVSNCNREAYQTISKNNSQSSNHKRFIVYGPTACGKSHLLHIYAQSKHAQILTESELNKNFEELNIANQQTFAIDDADKLSQTAQNTLFHLYNHCWQNAKGMLLTMSQQPQLSTNIMPDLQSRLNSLITIQIQQADDLLLRHFLRKNFADKQIYPNDDVLNFALCQWPREFSLMRILVKQYAQLILAKKHLKPTKPLITETLKIYEHSIYA